MTKINSENTNNAMEMVRTAKFVLDYANDQQSQEATLLICETALSLIKVSISILQNEEEK